MSTTVRRVALSAAVVAALTGVAACGSSDSGKDGGDKAAGKTAAHVSPIAALRSAEKSTDKADSAKVRSTTSIGDLMSMTANGALTWGDGLKGNLTITYTGGQMAELMKKAGTQSMEARYLPDAYYAHMSDAYAQQAGGGKHWIKYSYDDLAKLGGASGSYMKDQIQNATPNQSVKMLLASGDVKKVGEETVSGVHTTHYSGTLNVADLAGRTSDLSAEQLSALKKQLSQAGVTTDTVDIWINDQDLLVKKTEKADTANGAMTNTSFYSDYGVKVTAEAPPAGDTKDFADMLKSGGTLTGGTGTTS
ncbi:putative lipoprotein [Streptomyces canarius]|uniref:Lipoprotein n=2 Tax=Streptomyces TaxID=1883 RepID=A0ABQ3CME7_9ACTN|nr:putative lipoprotein [Streptomyces canarius]